MIKKGKKVSRERKIYPKLHPFNKSQLLITYVFEIIENVLFQEITFIG